MGKRKKYRQKTQQPGGSVQAFGFGDPEPVLNGAIYDNLGVWLLDNGQYYQPPVPLRGLARLLRANAYHGPILEFKTNVVLRGVLPSPALSRRTVRAAATDYMVFANAYLRKVFNWYGELIGLEHLPAINMRHMGYVFYAANANLQPEDSERIKKAIEGSKGIGNFRNMYLHIPNGREKDIQILPVGDFSTRDELEKIKNISRDDIIAAHRIPPAMASIIPTNNAGFGDITKIDAVYEKNEITPVREVLLEVNEHLPERAKVGFVLSKEAEEV